MPATPPKTTPLTAAAASLDSDLRAFETAVQEVSKVRLDTRKNLERAGRELQEASVIYGRMQERVGTLATELQAAQQRAIGAGTTLHELGTDLARRQGQYLELVAAYEGLMTEALALKDLAEKGPEAVAEVQERLSALSTRAGEMAGMAKEAGFRDLAEDASGRQQQLMALANRLGAQA